MTLMSCLGAILEKPAFEFILEKPSLESYQIDARHPLCVPSSPSSPPSTPYQLQMGRAMAGGWLGLELGSRGTRA
jgi:hypothetical protein